MDNRFRPKPAARTAQQWPSDTVIKQDLLIGLLVLLACYGPYVAIEHARSRGIDGPLVLIPFFIAFFTGFVPMSVAVLRRMKECERAARRT